MDYGRLLIALDLDGTLLTSKDTISAPTKKVLRRVINDGHIVVICTGRPFRRSKIYYDELNLSTPIINFHGAYIHHPQDSKWEIIHSPLNLNTAQYLLDLAHEIGVKNVVFELMEKQILIKDTNIELMNAFFHPNDIEIHSLSEIKLQCSPTSMLLHPPVEQLETIKGVLDKKLGGMIRYEQWGPPWNLLEILNVESNKAWGLKKVCDYYHIPAERVIAFGDSFNDLEMIDFAGIGVAMGNAVPLLKEHSNVIVPSNDEHGIALFLEDYLYASRNVIWNDY